MPSKQKLTKERRNYWISQTLLAQSEIKTQAKTIRDLFQLVDKYRDLTEHLSARIEAMAGGLDSAMRHWAQSEDDKARAMRAHQMVKGLLDDYREMLYWKEHDRLSKAATDAQLKRIAILYESAPRFQTGKSENKVNYRALERLLCQYFPDGVLGKKFYGDGKGAKKLIMRLIKERKLRV